MCIWNVFTTKSWSQVTPTWPQLDPSLTPAWPQLDPNLTPSLIYVRICESLPSWLCNCSAAWLHHSREWLHHCMTTEYGNVGSFLQHSITFCICVIGLQMVTWPHRPLSASYTGSLPLALYNWSQHPSTSQVQYIHIRTYVCMSSTCYVYETNDISCSHWLYAVVVGVGLCGQTDDCAMWGVRKEGSALLIYNGLNWLG